MGPGRPSPKWFVDRLGSGVLALQPTIDRPVPWIAVRRINHREELGNSDGYVRSKSRQPAVLNSEVRRIGLAAR